MAYTITPLGDGRYKIRAWSKFKNEFGTRDTKQITTHKTTVVAAERMAKLLEEELSQNRFKEDIKFVDLFKLYQASRVKINELNCVSDFNVDRLEQFFKQMRAKDVSTRIMQQYVDFLLDGKNSKTKKPMRNGTAKKHVRLINAALNWGVANDYLEHNRVMTRHLIYNEDETPFEATVISPETLGQILAYLKREAYNLYIPALLTASMSHRNSEALGERWEDLDLNNNALKISNSVVAKNNKTIFKNSLKSNNSKAVLHITDFVKNELLEHKELCAGLNSPFVCANPFIGLPKPEYVSKTFRKVVREKFGIDMRYYDLRHYFNQTLYLNGFTTEERCQVVRNTAKVNEKHYTHQDVAMTERQMEVATNSFLNVFNNSMCEQKCERILKLS